MSDEAPRRGTDYRSAPSPSDYPPAPPADGTRYGADLVVDALQAHDIEYVAINPGASFRGLHDSLVNYGAGKPRMLLCPNEGIAVGIAHGYAKAHSPARPMGVILHDVVGLLNGSMSIYIANLDRAPVLVMGGTGPLDEARRRPKTDWHHTANVQGNAVRDFTKWDDQPATAASIPDSFARAYRVALTEPQGPVYLCFDAGIQEDPLPEGFDIRPSTHTRIPAPMAPDASALDHVADLLVGAKNPVIVAQYLGRNHSAVDSLVDLAETLAVPVVDVRSRPNFPTNHPLNMSGSDIMTSADLVVLLDVKHPDLAALTVEVATRERTPLVPRNATWVDIGFGDIEISSWASDYGQFRDMDVSILADTSVAVPALGAAVKDRVTPAIRETVSSRAADLAERHAGLRMKWLGEARVDWDAVPMTTGRLALEVWDAIKDEDWVLTAGTLVGKVLKLWDFDSPYRHPGNPMGPGTQIGMSLGVALGHKGTGRLVVDLQPDGDLMYDASALWAAAKYEIPLLIVMHNNRAYYQDWWHQIQMAQLRGTPVERAAIGQDLDDPPPDFAALARSMGCYAEGPIEDPAELGPALRRAIGRVKEGGPALVDAVTRFR